MREKNNNSKKNKGIFENVAENAYFFGNFVLKHLPMACILAASVAMAIATFKIYY